MSLSRSSLLVFVLALFAPGLDAQLANDLVARHRHGQTFVTWRESPVAGVRYRVYRSTQEIQSDADLAQADFLGETDDKTSRNQGRSLATQVELNWVIENGDPALDGDQGLFVHTAEFPARSFYAVTSVQAGVEDTQLLLGRNSTQNAVAEIPAPPQPVVQATDAQGTLCAHWVGDRDTPFQPALSLLPSRGFNFRFEPGNAPGPHGLVVRLHAAGQTYAQGWPQRFEVPSDVDILALSDLHLYTGWTFWFGAHEKLPGRPDAGTRVWNYTQQRILSTLDWLVGSLGAAHDPERVYVVGGSMGAIGGMYLVSEYPERFAAAFLRNGNYDLLAGDYRNTEIFQSLFGSFSANLPTTGGVPVFQRTNGAFMANVDPARDWPVVRTINGRNDDTVGWASAVELYRGLATARRPAAHYFDDRDHSPVGYWRDLERSLLYRTFKTRRDRPSLRFGACSLDDDAGNGERFDGDLIGTIDGYVDYDVQTASATADQLSFDVYLRDQGLLDDAPEAFGWATLTPRRTGPFALPQRSLVHYTLREPRTGEPGRLVDEHWMRADEYGLITTPPVPLTTDRRQARFEHVAQPSGPTLWLGGAPLAGDRMQAVVFGPIREDFALVLALGNARAPSTAGAGLYRTAGHLDAFGARNLELELPAWLPENAWIWGRAIVDGRATPWAAVEVQQGAEHPSRPAR